MRLDNLSLQFGMHDTGLIGDVLEAYDRLFLDAMRGDHTLSTRLRELKGCGRGVHAVAGVTAAGAAVSARVLGAEVHPPDDCAACVTAAV